MMSQTSSQPSIMIADSTTLSHYTDKDSNLPTRICLVGSLQEDSEAIDAAKKFGISVLHSDTGVEYTDSDYLTYFILADFDSKEFRNIKDSNDKARILGKPALIQMSVNQTLFYKSRPMYCLSMKDCIIVFSGFSKRSEIPSLMPLVHNMGGSIKNEISSKVTHLVCNSSTGEKYHWAVALNIPVLSADWINVAWSFRDEIHVKADSDEFNKYKLALFHNLRIAFVGFSDEDRSQMEDLLHKNGGFSVPIEDSKITHVVIDDQNILEKPSGVSEKVHMVKPQWFWESIQASDICPCEECYLFEPMSNGAILSPRTKIFSPGTPGSRSRRRKRLRETVQQLADNGSPSTIQTAPPASKRRSSVSDLAFLSSTGDGSLIEDSFSTSTSALDKTFSSPPNVDLRQLAPRQRVFHELVQTECNYVAVLETINKVIKEPLEDPTQPGGRMLDSQELRYIFGNLPPIHEVHLSLRNRLLQLAHHWSNETSIGELILEFTDEMERAYPPFVNYFENVKELLKKVITERPRFHAFLKIAQAKPECGRQSLQELLIRPVQRLPSMSLLIGDILKHTDRSSPDFTALQQALDKIKSITTFINDDKRKTEAKLKLFEIHNDIENCPPNLVASHRNYSSKADVTELSDTCSGRGDSLCLFLFNDVLEICKKKSKYNSIKSPSRANLHQLKVIKSYKHLEMLQLSHIKRVVDIRETGDCHNVFALIVRSNQELKERLYTFTLIPEETNKADFIIKLSRNISSVLARSDVENFVVTMDPQHLDIETSDVSITNALSKALRFATRTGRKVSRAFSFNKSPSSKLKRAVSTVMSPFGNSMVHQAMRGATSVNNLADLPIPATPPAPASSRENAGDGMTCMGAPISTPTPRRRLALKRI